MRHFFVLGIVTLLMALLTAAAFHQDQARHLSRQQAVTAQIEQDLLRLELQFVEQATLLITVLNPSDPLLLQLEQARRTLPAMTDTPTRDSQFQALVARVRARVLKAPAADEASLQEWRRAQDQLNGTLHRHQVLLRQREESH